MTQGLDSCFGSVLPIAFPLQGTAAFRGVPGVSHSKLNTDMGDTTWQPSRCPKVRRRRDVSKTREELSARANSFL